jgi:hypothetical protein
MISALDIDCVEKSVNGIPALSLYRRLEFSGFLPEKGGIRQEIQSIREDSGGREVFIIKAIEQKIG